MSLSLPSPRVIAASDVPSLRWGVIGTGIAGKFVDALTAHTSQKVVAVSARNLEKTRRFARDHGIPIVHAAPSALVANPQVDVVYIATPHPFHHDLALEAIQAGKHVLIEKPIAMSSTQAIAITEAARAGGVMAMEAMWTRYLPQADVIRQVLEDGVIGEVNLVRADFGFVAPTDTDHRLWNASLGGGALLDAGIYPVSFASSVLGKPRAIKAAGAITAGGVDSRADLLLTHATGGNALLSTSLVIGMPVTASIMGSLGWLDVHSPFFGPTGVTLSIGQFNTAQTVDWRDEYFPGLYDGLSYQATAMASYVSEGRTESPVHPHHELVSVMATIDEARRQLAEHSSR